MGHADRQSIKFDRRSGLLLGYVFVMVGAGMILAGIGERDLVFPVGGGFFVVAGIAVALVGLKQPRVEKVEPVVGFRRFFQPAFLLLFVGFVFLSGARGLGLRWMSIVGVLLSMPYIISSVLLVVWFIASLVRKLGTSGDDA